MQILTFNQYTMISEKVISIGFDPEQESLREKNRQEIHDMLRSSYKTIGGYGGILSGSKEESNAIHDDITNSLIKAIRRGDKLTAVYMYKSLHGRKAIATGTDGTPQGKADIRQIIRDDVRQKRAWGEVSGAPEVLMRRAGAPEIPGETMAQILKKQIIQQPGNYYQRMLGGKMTTKIGLGFPKKNDK